MNCRYYFTYRQRGKVDILRAGNDGTLETANRLHDEFVEENGLINIGEDQWLSPNGNYYTLFFDVRVDH